MDLRVGTALVGVPTTARSRDKTENSRNDQ
jgi:hypothetical protein